MTRRKTAPAVPESDEFTFSKTAPAFDPFADDDFDDLFGPPTPDEKLTLLAVSLAEDPFTTVRTEDGENPFGGASSLARYERASAAYLAACHADDRDEGDDEREEILRLIAVYWLRRSKALWSV